EQPSRRPGDPYGRDEQHERREALYAERKAPGKRGVDVGCEVTREPQPAREHVPEDKEDGVMAYEPSTLVRRRQLREVHGARRDEDTDSQAGYNPTNLEHASPGVSCEWDVPNETGERSDVREVRR